MRTLDANYFTTSIVAGTRLRALAIQHSAPSINMMPIWSPHTAQLITEAMLRQKGKLTKAMTLAHSEGTLELKWSDLSTKGVPAWRCCLSHAPTTTLQQPISFVNEQLVEQEGSIDDPEFMHIFACPKCSGTRSITKCSLLVKSGWGHILCKACRITSRSKTWRCVCGRPWHNCTIHAQVIREAQEIREDG